MWAVICVVGLSFWISWNYSKLGNNITCIRYEKKPISESSSTILMLGNSLVHDHKWLFDGRKTVNCAVQGLTLKRFLQNVDNLPSTTPDLIIAAFGTVEVVRADLASKWDESDTIRINREAFQNDYLELISVLSKAWPAAKFLIHTVPPTRKNNWQRPARALQNISELNWVVNSLLAQTNSDLVSVVNMTEVFDLEGRFLAENMTYDGIHLTREAYTKWHRYLHSSMSKWD